VVGRDAVLGDETFEDVQPFRRYLVDPSILEGAATSLGLSSKSSFDVSPADGVPTMSPKRTTRGRNRPRSTAARRVVQEPVDRGARRKDLLDDDDLTGSVLLRAAVERKPPSCWRTWSDTA
jgi:hypothetical protein